MDPLTSTMVARAHFWPRLRRRTNSSKTSIGTIVSTMSGSSALWLMAEVEAPAEDELDDQVVRCARQANADAPVELPFRAHVHFFRDVVARLHVRGEHHARRHAGAVKRTVNSRIECQIPAAHLLVDDR